MLFATRGEQLPFKNLTTKKALAWLNNQQDIIIQTNAQILGKILSGINNLEKEIENEMPPIAKNLTSLE